MDMIIKLRAFLFAQKQSAYFNTQQENKWNASDSLAYITQFNMAAVLTLMVKVH